MAVHLLFTLPSQLSGLDPDLHTEVRYNDVTDTITATNTNQSAYRGPRIGEISPYYFCTGTTQTQFQLVALYPYARRVINQNAAVCTLVCDLYINNPLLTRPAAGAIGGQVTIRATTTAGSTLYSLDNQNWQASPVFTGLSVGMHTAYVKDSRNCTASVDFEIKQVDNYATRFTTTYKDTFQNTTTINILKRWHSGPAEEVRAGANPLIIRERSADMFATIRGQEAGISLIASESLQYVELFTGDDREFKVEVYKNGSLFWKGWIVGDVYQEPYLAPPYEVSISATDGLGELKKTPFSIGLPDGWLTQWQVFNHLMANVETQLPVATALNIYETRMENSPADDPMLQALVCMDAYHDEKKVWDCAAVLDAILKPYGAFIRQQGGQWHVGRAEEYKTSFYRRVYDTYGDWISYDHFTPVAQITGPRPTGPDKLLWVEKSQALELRPAYRSVSVHFDYGERDNIIPGAYFQEEDFEPWVHQPTQTVEEYRPKHWSNARVPVILDIFKRSQTDPKKNEYALFLAHSGSTTPVYATHSQRVPVRRDNGEIGIYFRFKVMLKLINKQNPNPNPVPANQSFTFQARVNGLYLKYDEVTGATSWVTTQESISLPAPWNSWQELEFVADSIPEDGWLTVSIMAQPDNPAYATSLYYLPGSFIREASAKLFKTETYLEKDETFTHTNPKKYYYTPETIEATHGEVIPLDNAPIMYRNTLLLNGQATLDWQRRGKFESRPILDILSESVLDLNKTPVKFLRGSLYGKFSWDKIIQEPATLTRYFLTGFEYNDVRNTISGEFMELLGTSTTPATGGNTIDLETGQPILLETGAPLEMEY